MSPQISWQDIALRLFLTVVASALIGFNREESGRSAGLRTTLLVGLAASLSMIQVNLLLGINGKTPSSFVVMDLMRLPLGILSGIGFIGAGAIMRKGSLVTGITTAATIWFVTVMGLCLGGGQLGLGITAFFLGILTLWSLKGLEGRWRHRYEGILTLVLEGRALDEEGIRRQVEADGGRISQWLTGTTTGKPGPAEYSCSIRWSGCPRDPKLPPFLASLSGQPGVVRTEWKIIGHG